MFLDCIDVDGDQDDEDIEDAIGQYDEREDRQAEEVHPRKKKVPFSFLMHHYLKTNGGAVEA